MYSLIINDLSFDDVKSERYDISIFASGFESRATYIPKKVKNDCVGNVLVMGFKEKKISQKREYNDRYYIRRWHKKPILLSTDDDHEIYKSLNESIKGNNDTIKILIDYSSMSRLWYSAVLNWARLGSKGKKIIIDFVYAMGEYKEERKPLVIKSMLSIPGCEGPGSRLVKSIAIFGLGFNGLASLCVLNQLEVDSIYLFYAFPGSTEQNEKKVLDCNEELIKSYKNKTKSPIRLPIGSIEVSYRILAEIISQHKADGSIIIVPMGPKPHVLSSILIAMRFPEVTCMRVSMEYPKEKNIYQDVIPTGVISASRVIIEK